MKNLIRSILVLTVLFSCSAARAQQQMQKRTPQERAQAEDQWMQKNLSLNDDQNKKVYDILMRHAQKAESIMSSSQAGPDKRQEMQSIKSNKDAELKGVLTGDQYQKYEAHMQEMQEKMRQRGFGSGRQQGG